MSQSLVHVRCESQFIPPISFFTLALKHTVLLEADENYQKRSFRNRCILASSHGPITLSIPLSKGKNEQQPIREVIISNDQNWQERLIRTIETCYRSAPYFSHYFPSWKDLLTAPYTHLWDLNWATIQLAIHQLGIETCMASLVDFAFPSEALAYGDRIHPRNFSSFKVCPYRQVFEESSGFLTNLSVLDLIFCCGPSARLILEASSSDLDF